VSVPFHVVVGQRTHTAIASFLRAGNLLPTLTVVSIGVARLLETEPLPCDRRRGQMLVASMTFTYLREFLPLPPWRLVGVEVDVDSGRFDLVFANDVGEVFIDELKARRGWPGQLDAASFEQMARYEREGAAGYGERFLGVRLVVLGPPAHAYWAGSCRLSIPNPPLAGFRTENLTCVSVSGQLTA
jgi:hypothetical protein